MGIFGTSWKLVTYSGRNLLHGERGTEISMQKAREEETTCENKAKMSS
jgi:hypothetical protein